MTKVLHPITQGDHYMYIREYIDNKDNSFAVNKLYEILEEVRKEQNLNMAHIELKDDELSEFQKEIGCIQDWHFESVEAKPTL